MSREEYMDAVIVVIKEKHPNRSLHLWDDPRWQRIINGMYDKFSTYTPAEQERLINSAGPKEPFWDRVVVDGAFAFLMWA